MNIYVYSAFILLATASVELISLLVQFFARGSLPSSRLFESLVTVVSLTAGMTIGFQMTSQLESTSQGVVVAGLTIALIMALGRLAIHYYNRAQQNAQTDRA